MGDTQQTERSFNMSEPNTQTQTTQTQPQQTEPNTTSPTFDYDKLANLIAGKQTVTEDTVLKSYFKQQGLSADEMTQAINAFKETKAKNTPDVSALQNNLTAEKNARLQAEINQSATLEAIKQGVDVNSIQYVLKMADFKDCVTEDGKINAEKLTNAIKTVLDDIPALKGTQQDNNGGIQKIGGDGGSQTETTEDTLRSIFGIKN
jgi:negative regulator of genetic competence, sporulation and motility